MSDEARLLFSAYRPGGQDADDPTFADAIEAAKNDPELAQWLAEQQAFDGAVAGHLRSVEVPPDLRARILAGAKVSRRRPWWALPRTRALAAALVVFAVIAGLWLGNTDGLADWQKRGLAVLDGIEANHESFDLEDHDAAALTAWLRGHAVPHIAALPAALDGKPTFGCKSIAWDGHKMSLICFDLGGGVAVHLFTTDRAGLAHLPPDGAPHFARNGAWTVAMWNEGDKTLMLATDKGEAPLRRVLQIATRTATPNGIALAVVR